MLVFCFTEDAHAHKEESQEDNYQMTSKREAHYQCDQLFDNLGNSQLVQDDHGSYGYQAVH